MEFEQDEITITPSRYRNNVVVEVDISDYVDEIINELGIKMLLDAIGQDECVSHFKLELKDE